MSTRTEEGRTPRKNPDATTIFTLGGVRARLRDSAYFKLAEALPQLRKLVMKAENVVKFVELRLAELSAEADRTGTARNAMYIAAQMDKWDELGILAAHFAVPDEFVAKIADESLTGTDPESVKKFFAIFPDRRPVLALMYKKMLSRLHEYLEEIAYNRVSAAAIDDEFSKPIFRDVLDWYFVEGVVIDDKEGKELIKEATQIVFSLREILSTYVKFYGLLEVLDVWSAFVAAHKPEKGRENDLPNNFRAIIAEVMDGETVSLWDSKQNFINRVPGTRV